MRYQDVVDCALKVERKAGEIKRWEKFHEITIQEFKFIPSHLVHRSLLLSPSPPGMALCDMFTLLCPAPGLIYMLTLGNHNQPLSGVATCHAWIAFYEVRLLTTLFTRIVLFYVDHQSLGAKTMNPHMNLHYFLISTDDPQHVSHRINMADTGAGRSKVRWE